MTQNINDLKENYTSLGENARAEYLIRKSQKLSNPDTGIKTYLSIIKKFLNKNKFPIIPPLFHCNKFIAVFQEKATFSIISSSANVLSLTQEVSYLFFVLPPKVF